MSKITNGKLKGVVESFQKIKALAQMGGQQSFI
jgi:hypothetical protein